MEFHGATDVLLSDGTVAGLLPIPYIEVIFNFIPFHFEISIGETVVGEYTRPSGVGDRYVLDLTRDTERVIDRRVALAFTVALDALQDR